MTGGFTNAGKEELGYHQVYFQNMDDRGNLISGSGLGTSELNLIPTEPLTITPFEERTELVDAPGCHGTMESGLYADMNVYSNATGSWTFYYVHDGQNRSTWDNCSQDGCTGTGIAAEYGQTTARLTDADKARQNYDGWYAYPWTFLGMMRRLLTMLQGKRVQVTLPGVKTYKGRCCVSSFDTNENGQMQATISYDLAPPGSYPN